MTPCAIVYVALVLALGGGPSYAIADRAAHPWWRRVLACLPVAGFFYLIGLGLPTYPPGRNMDDWRRGFVMMVAAATFIGAVVVQLAIVTRRFIDARRR